MSKIVKICLISFVLLGVFAVCFCASFVGINYARFSQIPLQAEALSEATLTIPVYDSENKKIKEENQFSDSVRLDTLPQHTINAFISIEDKDFFRHNGLNYKRMVGACLKNIKSLSLKEGASTISQQLIKNTHLSSEKTFKRKLKEIALTQKLENQFDKNQILECYLNVIFFGNNCYGIESAARYYFDKSAKDLSLAESAVLAGMIKSPAKYSPIHNPEKAKARRDLVLSEMEKDGYITVDEKMTAQNSPLGLNLRSHAGSGLNSYSQAAIDEAAKILKITPKQLAVGGYHLHTYQNETKQNALVEAIENVSFENLEDCDKAAIVIDSQSFGVTAFVGESNFKILECRRQPASCLKPLLVYAPALNEGIVSPKTQILDEKITIGGYSPSNVNKKYNGYMSVTDAVKNSVNIPAIKVLSYIGIDTGKQYAEKLGISFDENDDSYALALGGMTYGVNLKDLASAYTAFPAGGKYADATFIQYITDSNNKLVYVHKPESKMVLREDAAYLMTNILCETAKTGTARRLSSITSTEVAAKTGTVGKKNEKGNTDAYSMAYTPEEVVGVWCGNLNNKPLGIAGGNQPTEVAKNYIETQTYEKNTFELPSSVAEVEIDKLELEENHRLVLASPYSPERYVEKALFSRFYAPSEVSKNFTQKPEVDASVTIENGQIVVNLKAQKHVAYQIFKNDVMSGCVQNKNGEVVVRLAMPETEATVKIVAAYSLGDDTKAGENKWKNSLTEYKTFELRKEESLKAEEKQESKRPKAKWFI